VKFRKFFIFSLVLLAAMAALNFLAFKNFWYWRWPWFDQPMHFVGGLLVGLVAVQVFLFFGRRDHREIAGWDIALVSIAAALLVGATWEWFEFTADQHLVARVELKTLNMVYNGWAESLKDLVFDLSGGATAAILFFISLIWQQKKAP